MNPTPISDFDDVILFELQKKVQQGKLPSISFGEIWKASSDAAENFDCPVDPNIRRQAFSARLFQALDLLEKIEYVRIISVQDNNIESIQLTESGINQVSKIVYTHQQRAQRL